MKEPRKETDSGKVTGLFLNLLLLLLLKTLAMLLVYTLESSLLLKYLSVY